MRLLLSIFYIALVVFLGVFAKDNLIAEFNHLIPSTNPKKPALIKTAGSMEVAFSPNGNATDTIVKAIAEAQKSILVAAYSFTSKDIAQALLKAKKRQITIKLILDKSQVSASYSSSGFFYSLGFDLKIDTKHAIYHNKVMIIDNNTVITGSFNFTKAAENKNAENVLIIRNNPQLAELYTQNWQDHWHHAITLEAAQKNLKQPISAAK